VAHANPFKTIRTARDEDDADRAQLQEPPRDVDTVSITAEADINDC
jgi:hypothetical protein